MPILNVEKLEALEKKSFINAIKVKTNNAYPELYLLLENYINTIYTKQAQAEKNIFHAFMFGFFSAIMLSIIIFLI